MRCSISRGGDGKFDPAQLFCPNDISVTSSSKVTFRADATPISPSGFSWLRIQDANSSSTTGATSLTNLQTPATIRIVLAPNQNLPLGNILGVIKITAGTLTKTVVVKLQVTPNATLSAIPVSLSFTTASSGSPQTVTLYRDTTSPDAAKYTTISLAAQTTYLDNSGWLTVQIPNSTVTGSGQGAGVKASISVNPALPAGSYIGYVTFDGGPAGSQLVDITYNSTYTPPAASVVLKTDDSPVFDFKIGATPPASHKLSVDSSTGVSLPYTVQVTDPNGWLTVTNPDGAPAASGNTPATLTLKPVPPSALPAGVYNATVALKSGQQSANYTVVLNLIAMDPGPKSLVQSLAHIADGGGWKTSVVLANPGSAKVTFTINFLNDNGAPLKLPLGPDGTVSTLTYTIMPGGSRTIQSDGSTPALTTGWAEVTSDGPLGGFAVFGLGGAPGQPDSEAAVPLAAGATGKFVIPFETAATAATGVAIANPDATQSASVNIRYLDGDGNPAGSSGTYTVPPRGHVSFVLPSVAAPRGSAEVTTFGANILGLGIRGHGGAFTSVEALGSAAAGSKLIAHIADGGGWKTSFVLVNTDTQPADFTLRFWGDNGAARTLPLSGTDGTVSTLTGTIHAHGARTVQSTGAGSALTTGWADLTTTAAVGGTAIFGVSVAGQPDSEAAVPLLTGGGTQFVIPFDTTAGYATGVALANPSATQEASVSVALQDNNGVSLGSLGPYKVPAHGHTSFVLPAPAGVRGTATFSSPGLSVAALGIRSHAGAFTSVETLGQ